MKKLMRNRGAENGFTLIEVIITLVIGAILASFLVTFMGTAITKSSEPVNQARNLGESTGNIEIITAAYASYLAGGKTWAEFKAACVSPVTITTGDIYNANFETLQVTITTGNQKIVSYFMN